MHQVAVGSGNPAKVEAVRLAFAELHPDDFALHPLDTDGGDDQPWGEPTTRDGATRRAAAALAQRPDADWGIGLEGGMVRDDAGILVTSWIAAQHADGRLGLARTPGFYLPGAIADVVRAGGELADAWHRLHGIEQVGRRGGTVGLLTGGRIERTRLYADSVVLAVAIAEQQARNDPRP